MAHPYQNLPDHQFWRRAVADRQPASVDPMLETSLRIARSDKVATAGSCFAQNIAAALRARGMNYYIPEPGPADARPQDALERNFGVFSCRYGNIYTTRQLLQLLRRAYGRFTPDVDAWTLPNGRCVDPFRPQVEPEGFASLEALHADRVTHLAAVRHMFETMDFLVFTLGQTECWETIGAGAVTPLAPGVAGGDWDASLFRFHNLTAGEIAADFLNFANELAAVNPAARLIVTVSPVPLIATYEPSHALVANVATKARLRVAVDDIRAARPDIVYFPSFEIVTAPVNAARFYADDLRSVTPLGVAQVMRIFFRHFTPEGEQRGAAPPVSAGAEARGLAAVVCDEEALDPGRLT